MNGEKKEAKAEKRKSSLPFTLGGKKEKPTSDDEGKKKESAFSKLRATIKVRPRNLASTACMIHLRYRADKSITGQEDREAR